MIVIYTTSETETGGTVVLLAEVWLRLCAALERDAGHRFLAAMIRAQVRNWPEEGAVRMALTAMQLRTLREVAEKTA